MARLHLWGEYTDLRPWDGDKTTPGAARSLASLAAGPSGGAGVLGAPSAGVAAVGVIAAADTPLASDAAACEALLGACVGPPAA